MHCLIVACCVAVFSAPVNEGSKPVAASKTGPLTIYMLWDMEGVSGLMSREQTWYWENGVRPEAAEEGRRLITADVQSAVAAALQAGAERVIVCDTHHGGGNIRLEEMPRDSRVTYYGRDVAFEGTARRWMPGLDSTVNGLMLMGHHAKARTQGAFLPHTQTQQWADLAINGRSVGEIGLEACYAGHWNVPLILVQGDEAACKETDTQFPGVVTACVKRAKSRDLCEGLEPEAARRLTAQKVAEAIQKLRTTGFTPYKLALPLRVTVRMASEELAAKAVEKRGLRPVDSRTVECEVQRQCDVNKRISGAGLAMIPPKEPQPQTPPNVLLVITDQQRWDTLAYTGKTPCRTPSLDRLARQGVALDRCLTSAPLCSPARAALMTGRYPGATGVLNNDQLPLQRPTLLEVFRDAGYDVAYSGKWHLGRGRGAIAIPTWPGEREAYVRWLTEHGFSDTHPYGKPGFAFHMPGTGEWISTPHTAATEGPAERTYDAWIAAQALENLDKRPAGKPFFHVCSFWGPHPIFVIPEPYYSMYDPAKIPEPANFADPMQDKPRFQSRSIWHEAARAHGTTWEPWRKSQAVYWGYVTWLDTLIGRLLDRLDALGLTNDTIVIFTSDHGEQMGSHGIFQKCCMYEESLRVPLLIRAPGRLSAGRRLAVPVSHVDVAPTLMRLCNVGERGFPLLEPQGRDLSGWLTDAEAAPEHRDPQADPTAGAVFSQYTPEGEFEQMTELRCVIAPRYKYAWNRQDADELYDIWEDPAELHNRATDPALGTIRQEMRGCLQQWLDRIQDPHAAELRPTSPKSRNP